MKFSAECNDNDLFFSTSKTRDQKMVKTKVIWKNAKWRHSETKG